MTIREYAKENNIEIVGKLKRMSVTKEKFNPVTGEMEQEKVTFWVDDAGNEFHKDGNAVMAIDKDGNVY